MCVNFLKPLYYIKYNELFSKSGLINESNYLMHRHSFMSLHYTILIHSILFSFHIFQYSKRKQTSRDLICKSGKIIRKNVTYLQYFIIINISNNYYTVCFSLSPLSLLMSLIFLSLYYETALKKVSELEEEGLLVPVADKVSYKYYLIFLPLLERI